MWDSSVEVAVGVMTWARMLWRGDAVGGREVIGGGACR